MDEFTHNDNPQLSYEQMQAKLHEKQKLYEKLSKNFNFYLIILSKNLFM